MANDTVVTAIMPTYNNAPFLSASVQSIVEQTYSDWELIIVDDGSTDDTTTILSSGWDSRIKIHRLEKNLGAAAARNYAIERARGRYVAICDADDISLPTRFAKQVSTLESRREIGVVGAQMMYFWETADPQPLILYPESSEAIQRRFSRGRMAVPHAASMIRTDLFHKHGFYTRECRRAQDLEFFLRIRHDCCFSTLPEFLVLYRHQVERVSFTKWLRDLRYEQYALYLSELGAGTDRAERLSFEQYPGNWRSKATFYVSAWLRYLNYRARTERTAPHRLQ